MTPKEKLSFLRRAMERRHLDAYIIPSADPHMSEYLPDRWRIMAWLTGFTGSAGTVVITRDFAGVWTDSRYFLQAEEQLAGSGFVLVRLRIPHTPEWIDWLAERSSVVHSVGYDGTRVSLALARQMRQTLEKRGVALLHDADLITPLWDDRPAFPGALAFEHPPQFAVRSIHTRLQQLREEMSRHDAGVLLLTALDEVAWTFNIRGNDILYNPVVMAWGLVTQEEATLFIRSDKLPQELRIKLEAQGVGLEAYEALDDALGRLPAGTRLLLSPASVNEHLYRQLPPTVKVVSELSPAARLKAVKNREELEHIRHAMVKDGVALTRFFRWLEQTLGREPVTEVTAAARLEQFRAEEDHFHGPSFATISSWGPHGAVVHYTPSEQSDVELKAPGIYLLDSGGQYFDGTTDITRTIVLGTPTAQQKRDFTLVLKGMTALARARFPEGTQGHQLDILARRPLWDEGLNYGHGTGHGVGFFLNVHEYPPSISPRAGNHPPLAEGMILSDEPGLYRDGEYGIRTENIVAVVKDRETPSGTFLRFETLTLCYIDTRLIDSSLLTEEEIIWLNEYHKRVYETLAPRLDETLKNWLKEKTKEIGKE